MAETQVQATLGLVITAKDEAKSVFEAFATTLKEQMTKIEESMRQAFNMDTIMSDVDKACTSMVESFDKVATAETRLRDTNVAGNIDEQMTAMTEAVTRMEESVTRSMDTSVSDTDRFRTAMQEAMSGISFSGLESQLTTLTESTGRMETAVTTDLTRVAEATEKMAARMNEASHGINYMEIQNAGMMMSDAGKRMLGFFGEAVKAGVDFDQSIVNTTASLNANLTTTKLSTDQIDAMKRSALDMGSVGFFSANQISEAMNTMAKQGINYSTIMNGGINTVYKVAAANQQGLEETANVVSDIYNEMQGEFTKMGLSTQQSAQVIGNSMTVALHHARLSMSDFLSTMKYVGPQASAVGMSIQDVSTAIAVLGEHGIKSSQAGTTLRRMLTNLTPSSKAAAAEMNKLGMVVNGNNIFYDQSTGKMKSMADIQTILHDKLSGLSDEQQQFAIKTIFGQYALSGMTAIVNTAPSAFSKLTNEMKNNGEMDEILNEKKKGLGFQVQALQAHFATLQKEIGMALAPLLVSLIGIATKLMDAFQGMNPHVQKALVVFGALTAVLLTVGGAAFTLIGTFGMFKQSFGVAMEAFADIGVAIGPVLIVIGLLVAAWVAVSYAWKKDIGGIREYVSQFVNWFQPLFGKTFDKVKKDVESGLAALTKGFSGWNLKIMGPVNRAMSEVWRAISDGMKRLVTTVANGITGVTGWFKKMAPQFNEALKRIVAFLIWLTPLWNAMWTVLKFVVTMVFDWIRGIIQHFWGVFSGVIQLITDLINGKWKAVFQDLWQIVKNALLLALDLWGGAVGKFFGGFAKIIEHTGIFGKAFTKLLSGPFKAAEKLCDALWKSIEKFFDGGVKVVRTILKVLWDVVSGVFKAVAKAVTTYLEPAMMVFKFIFTTAFGIVKILFQGWLHVVIDIFKAVKSLFSGEPSAAMKFLVDAFKAGFNTVKGVLETYWGAVSKVFKTVTTFIGDNVGKAMDFLKKAWDTAINYVKGILDGWWTNIKDVFEKVKTTITDAVTKALDFLKTKFETQINFVKTIISVFRTIVQAIFIAIKDLITGHSEAAMNALKFAWNYGIAAARAILQGLWSMVDSILGGLPGKFLSWASKAMSELSSGINNGIGWVRNNVSQIINVMGAALANLGPQMYQWAVNGINMFVSGIKSGIGAVGNAVQGIGNTIKNFLGMHSPAKMGPLGAGESDKWFPNMMAMFEKGINDNKDKITKATMGVAVGVQQTITGTQDHIHQFVNGSKSLSGTAINNNNMNNQRQLVVNINVEGRSVQTDKQLAENIARQFRTQMPMVTS